MRFVRRPIYQQEEKIKQDVSMYSSDSVVSGVDLMLRKVREACNEMGKTFEYNLNGFIRMVLEDGFLIRPTLMGRFSDAVVSEYSALYCANRYCSDVFGIMSRVPIQYSVNGKWVGVEKGHWPIIRRTVHMSKEDMYATSVMHAGGFSPSSDVGNVTIDYVKRKDDGVTAVTFDFVLENGHKEYLAIVSNRLSHASPNMPLSGELVGKTFFLQAGYETVDCGNVVSIDDEQYGIVRPTLVMPEAVYADTELIVSSGGVEYKVKNDRTVDLRYSKGKVYASDSKGPIAEVTKGAANDGEVVEGLINVTKKTFEILKVRGDKLRPQSQKDVGRVVNSVTVDELKNYLGRVKNQLTGYNVELWPDSDVLAYLTRHLFKDSADKERVISAGIIKGALNSGNVFVSRIQMHRLLRKLDVLKQSSAKMHRYPLNVSKTATRAEVARYVIDSGMTLPPIDYAEIICEKMQRRVSVYHLISLCSTGNLMYLNNAISAPMFSGKIVEHKVEPLGRFVSPFPSISPTYSKMLVSLVNNHDITRHEAAVVTLANTNPVLFLNVVRLAVIANYGVGSLNDEDVWESLSNNAIMKFVLDTCAGRYQLGSVCNQVDKLKGDDDSGHVAVCLNDIEDLYKFVDKSTGN